MATLISKRSAAHSAERELRETVGGEEREGSERGAFASFGKPKRGERERVLFYPRCFGTRLHHSITKSDHEVYMTYM